MPTSILRVVNLGMVGGVTGYDGLPPFALCLTFELYLWILTQLLPEVASSPSFPISHDRAEVSQLLSSACRPHSLLPIPSSPSIPANTSSLLRWAVQGNTLEGGCARLFKETHLSMNAQRPARTTQQGPSLSGARTAGLPAGGNKWDSWIPGVTPTIQGFDPHLFRQIHLLKCKCALKCKTPNGHSHPDENESCYIFNC